MKTHGLTPLERRRVLEKAQPLLVRKARTIERAERSINQLIERQSVRA